MPTIPLEPTVNPDLPVIPAGAAEEALRSAFEELAVAYMRAEAIAMACARALDTAARNDGMRRP